MWKAYIKGNYFILENGNQMFTRLRRDVQIRKDTVEGATYTFSDEYTTFATADLENIKDEAGNAYTQAQWDNFYFFNTGTGSLLDAKVPIPDADSGYQLMTIEDNPLNLDDNTYVIPSDAVRATIMIEAHSTSSDPTKCLRYTENDDDPTVANGFFLGDGDVIEIPKEMFSTFSMISAEAGVDVFAHIQYYKYY